MTITVKGNVRWKNIDPRRYIQTLKPKVVQQANNLNRKHTPKGETGDLQESFTHKESERTLNFTWNSPYATYVDQGIPESEGRYVPAIDKRLTMKPERRRVTSVKEAKKLYDKGFVVTKVNPGASTFTKRYDVMMERPRHQISAPRQVYKEARQRGLPEWIAKQALTTRIEESEAPFFELGSFLASGVFERKYSRRREARLAKTTGYPETIQKVRGSKRLTEEQRHAISWNIAEGLEARVRTGRIAIATGGEHPQAIAAHKRHELGHLMDFISGRMENWSRAMAYENRPEEISARMWEKAAGLQHGDIGTHPGFEGREFSQKIVDELKIFVVESTIKHINDMIIGGVGA